MNGEILSGDCSLDGLIYVKGDGDRRDRVFAGDGRTSDGRYRAGKDWAGGADHVRQSNRSSRP